VLEGHEGELYDLSFSLDGKMLVSGSGDFTVRLWDVELSLGNLSSRSTRTSGSKDDAEKPIVLAVLDNVLEEMRDIDVDGDDLDLSNDSVRQAGDESEDQMDVDYDNPEKATTINSKTDSTITSIAISPDGRYVAAGSLDDVIRLWDLRPPSSSKKKRQPPVLIERLKGHKDGVYNVSFAKNGRFLVSASSDKDLRVWDVAHLGIVPAPESLSSSSSLARGPGDRDPARGNDWPVTAGKGKQKSCCTMRLVGHWDYTPAVAVSPNGRWVVSGSKDLGAMWWDLSAEDSSSSRGEPWTTSMLGIAAVTKRDREAVCRVNGHANTVISVDFSPVGNMWATASGDGKARICESSFTFLNVFIY
jgi:glucose repression regulatory protein TUP1